jgi:hypothetical protein
MRGKNKIKYPKSHHLVAAFRVFKLEERFPSRYLG